MSLDLSLTVNVQAAGNPAWYTSATTSEWLSLTGGPAPTLSAVDPCPAGTCSYSGVENQPAVVADWCTAVVSPDSMLICAQGGHAGYGGNEVYEYMFNVATPRWYMRVAPSTTAPQFVSYYPDGKPSSRHGYGHECYIGPGTNGNRWFSPYAFAVWSDPAVSFNVAASYSRTNGTYDPQNTFPNFPGVTHFDLFTGYDPVTHKVWVREAPGSQVDYNLWSLDVATKAWSSHGIVTSTFTNGEYIAAMVDPVRRLLVAQAGTYLFITDIGRPNDNSGRRYTVSGLSGSAIAYDPIGGKWINWNGGKTLRVINPPSDYRTGDGSTSNPLNASATYAVTQTITPAGGATPTAGHVNGTYGRFNYIAEPHGLAVVNATSQPMYFFKIPSGGF